MITLEGEITETSCPPNRADNWRTVTIWLPESEEHVEFIFDLNNLQKAGWKEGDKLLIKFEKLTDYGDDARDPLNP